MRKPLLVALVLLTASAACTSLLGDFTSGTAKDAGVADTGTVGQDAGEDAEETSTVTVTANAPDVSVYLGQTAKLDGSKSTTSAGSLTFDWTVDKVPSGSNVSTNGLQGATSSTPSFTPDVLGDYVLELAVAAFGVTNTIQVNVHCVLPGVFYAQGEVTDAGPTAVYTTASYDGGGAHAVTCPNVVVTSVQNEVATFGAYGGRAFDYWEAPAGQPSKFAGFLVDYQTGNQYFAHLYSGTTASLCDAGVNDLGSASFGPGHPYGSDPHFSSDGTRFVVYDDKWNIVTYTADGSNPTNVVTTYPLPLNAPGLDPSGASGFSGYTAEPPRVEWLPNSSTELAWAAPHPLADGGLGWAIFKAKDSVGSTPTTFMTCSGNVPREFAILPDQTVIASYRQTPTSGENIVHLQSNGGVCDVELSYTTVGNVPGAIATDFAVSPDFTQIAYLQVDPTSGPTSAPWFQGDDAGGMQIPGGYVYVVPVNGGSPKQVSPTPALYGPRWLGGGSTLIFTGLNGSPAPGRFATSVVIVHPDGTGQAVVAQGDGVNTFVSTSGNAACTSAPGLPGSPVAGALLSLAAIAELVRRRRRH